MTDNLKPDTWKCLDCQTTGNLTDFLNTNKCCKSCGKKNLEIKFSDDENVYGPLAGIHFTTQACPKCNKIKDVKIHYLSPALGMSEKEFKKKMREEDQDEYCSSLTHKPWFWGATIGGLVGLAGVIGLIIWLTTRKKKTDN